MAHEIESMFFVGETPWHGLGQKLGEAPTTAEAIKQAGLAWRVLEVPIRLDASAPADAVTSDVDAMQANGEILIDNPFGHSAPLARRDGEKITSHKALVRSTDGALLGVVGSKYQPLQNDQAFNFFDPLVSAGLVTLETAGSLRQGKRVWILARISDNSDIKIVGDDIIRKFFLLSNGHDGTLAVRVGFSAVRVVCANTLALAHRAGESQLIRLKHGRSVVQNLENLREIINVANQSFEASAEQFRFLATRQISQKDLAKYVKVVLGHEATDDEKISVRTANQIGEIIDLFEHGRGNREVGVKGTYWAAYNAVTEYLSHQAGHNADSRYNSLWFGENANRNLLALETALEMADAA
jgi:phage/plasmid-like protein (TIGR03299 family)